MNDRKLAELALDLHEMKAQAKVLAEEIDSVQKKISDELRRRGTKQLVTNGMKITLRSNTYTNYNFEVLKRRLRKKPAVLDRITSTTLDKAALAAEVAAGNISPTTLDAATDITESAPWPVVTKVADSE